jgi:hypothetical protein
MEPKTMQVFIGYDPKEDTAYQVARNSIVKRTPEPVKIMPLRLDHLPMLTRPVERKDGKLWCPISQAPMSTEFAISRFCVPFLQDDGWALFVDCDIICWSDIRELFHLADDKYAVMCVQHKQESGPETKMDGQVQTYYDRKNWSSVVLWNCGHPANKGLTELRLNGWTGRALHAFKWLEDSEIGELPQEWNWLINVTPGKPELGGIWHYTEGGPWVRGWKPQPYDSYWENEAQSCAVLA